ncbi:MAG: NAD(P)H-binding protein [Nitrospira sp.]
MTMPVTLVLGATGKTGRRIAERLMRRHWPVRIGSRAGTPPFDWNEHSTWPAALRGVGAVYVSYYPDLAAPGSAENIRAFAELAVQSGVRHLVLLSGRGEPEAQRCEQIVQQAVADWTLVRCSWFAQNFSENYLLEPLLTGEVTLPAGNVGEPFVDVNDIADVVVAALTGNNHMGQLYELTGPRLWTFAQAIEEIAHVTRREIRYREVSIEEYASVLEGAHVRPDFVTLLTYLFSEVLDGRNARMADGVMRALGRAPRAFTDYVRDTAATGVWDPSRSSVPAIQAAISKPMR